MRTFNTTIENRLANATYQKNHTTARNNGYTLHASIQTDEGDEDISSLITSMTIKETNANTGVQMSMTLVGAAGVADKFTPGRRISTYFLMGTISTHIPLGIFYIDETSWAWPAGQISVSARNAFGFRLRGAEPGIQSSYDSSFLGLLSYILTDGAGITYTKEPALSDFQASGVKIVSQTPYDMVVKDLNAYLLEARPAYADLQIKELVDGTILVGRTPWLATYDAPGQISVSAATIYSRSIRRSADSSITAVRVQDTVSFATAETDHNGWPLPPKVKRVAVDYALNYTDRIAYAEREAAAIKNRGITETIVMPYNPKICVGDTVAMTEGDTTSVLGIITSVQTKIGRTGWSTTITVDSGGTITSTTTSTQADNGFTGRQTMVDIMAAVTAKRGR